MQKHQFSNGFSTNFEYIKTDSAQKQKFTILYTHGFCSDPWGRKPEEIKKWCLAHHIPFFRYELAGHGADKANFEQTDINIWKAQILEIIDNIIEGPVLVAGSSLGGWLSMLAALLRPERITGLLGLAAAPDFTKDNQAFLTPAQIEEFNQKGKVVIPGTGIDFLITKRLVESGAENLLLEQETLPITCQTVLIQGMQDRSVDWHKALKIAQKIRSEKVMVKLLKNSNHRLNEDGDIAEILSALDSFL